MAQRDPNQIAQDWATKLGASTSKITAGVQSVTVAPGQAAARQKAAWVNNTQASADKWARNTAAVPLSSWQDAMVNKGAARIGQGATAAVPKMASFMQQLLPFVDNTVASLPPRGDLNANINRAVTFMTKMSAFKRNA